MHTRVKPYRQGDLDGLCGIYAIINALRLLCPELDDELSDRLFRKLVNATAKRRRKPLRVVWGGMDWPLVQQLTKTARRDVARTLSIQLIVEQLEVQTRKFDVTPIWSALQKALDGSCVAILGLAGRHHHWTVAYQVSDRQMRLQDSGQLKVLLRSRCSSAAAERRYVLSPENVILLRRSGTNASDHDDPGDRSGPPV